MKSIKVFIITILYISFQSNLFAKTNFFDEALNFFKKKQFNKAKIKFEQDIVFDPKSEESYLYLSKIFNKKKKFKLEEQNLNTVILLNPENEEAVFNLAKLKLNNSDYIESKKLINRLLLFCKNYCLKSKNLKIEIEKSQTN